MALSQLSQTVARLEGMPPELVDITLRSLNPELLVKLSTSPLPNISGEAQRIVMLEIEDNNFDYIGAVLRWGSPRQMDAARGKIESLYEMLQLDDRVFGGVPRVGTFPFKRLVIDAYYKIHEFIELVTGSGGPNMFVVQEQIMFVPHYTLSFHYNEGQEYIIRSGSFNGPMFDFYDLIPPHINMIRSIPNDTYDNLMGTFMSWFIDSLKYRRRWPHKISIKYFDTEISPGQQISAVGRD